MSICFVSQSIRIAKALSQHTKAVRGFACLSAHHIRLRVVVSITQERWQMASYVEMTCDHCGLGPGMVGGGPVMRPGLFVDESGYCPHCTCIVEMPVPLAMRDLEDLADYSGLVLTDPLPKTHAELAELAIRLRSRPSCPHCHRRARRLRPKQTDIPEKFECPRCGEPSFRATGRVIDAD